MLAWKAEQRSQSLVCDRAQLVFVFSPPQAEGHEYQGRACDAGRLGGGRWTLYAYTGRSTASERGMAEGLRETEEGIGELEAEGGRECLSERVVVEEGRPARKKQKLGHSGGGVGPAVWGRSTR
eukprot:1790564-Rhodomonas_salina.2